MLILIIMSIFLEYNIGQYITNEWVQHEIVKFIDLIYKYRLIYKKIFKFNLLRMMILYIMSNTNIW